MEALSTLSVSFTLGKREGGNMTKRDGLGAAGFLLLAEGHLRRAREVLLKEQRPSSRDLPYLLVDDACDDARRALKLLKEEEEP